MNYSFGEQKRAESHRKDNIELCSAIWINAKRYSLVNRINKTYTESVKWDNR